MNAISIARNVLNVLDTSGAVEILWIKAADEEYHDQQKKIDLKTLAYEGKKTTIHYQVRGRSQRVTLWIEYEGSAVHDDFYNQYRSGDFVPPKVVTLVSGEDKDPGAYDVEWDGRDGTGDKRLLLAGKYKVKIEGESPSGKAEDDTGIEVALPHAHNYGIRYRKSGSWESTKKEVQHANAKQKALKGGTGFDAQEHLATTAKEAAEQWQASAVTYWSGHSNPAGIVFHAKEGTTYSKADRSILRMTEVPDKMEPSDASLEAITAAGGNFRDTFLVMLNGCRTGNEIMLVQHRLKKCFPGPLDGIHGPKTTEGLKYFQKINDLPQDGTKNEPTLARLGIDPAGKDEKQLTWAVQEKLRSYDPGEVDGIMGPKTAQALRNYQQDHPYLAVTGEPDEPTMLALKLSGEHSRNITEAAQKMGADIAIGFIHKVDFDVAESWAIEFWDNLANGDGVNKAANDAKASIDHRRRDQCEYSIYNAEGVPIESTLHPARYGKYAAK